MYVPLLLQAMKFRMSSDGILQMALEYPIW